MKYIHYGHECFDLEKFNKISNNLSFPTKPFGGLWACQLDSEKCWKDWCLDNEAKEVDFDKHFIFSLRDDSRILTIDSCEQLKKLPKLDYCNDIIPKKICTELNFEQLSKEYDAIEVFFGKDENLYMQLYGWDCDSIVIMNPDVVIPDEI